MSRSERQILVRHRRSLRGRLYARRLRSAALGLAKPYYVYEPPRLQAARAVPVLYLFRGHEREWVNIREDASRHRTTAIEDLDRWIAEGTLPPMLVVLPGLNSQDNRVPSLGIDMVDPRANGAQGLGRGRFWTYLTEELFPRIETRYPQIEGERRLMAGFSLGGYTVSLLALQRPGYFHHAAIYDGLFMWPRHQDPREDETGRCTDPVWCRASIFDAAFGRPRERRALRRWNPTDTLCQASGALLDALRDTRFWIACAAGEGNRGNRDRARFFVQLLRHREVPLGFDGGDPIYHPDAAHTWHWTDRFLMDYLGGVFAEEAQRLPAGSGASPGEKKAWAN